MASDSNDRPSPADDRRRRPTARSTGAGCSPAPAARWSPAWARRRRRAAQGAAPASPPPTSYRRIDAHTHFSSLKVLDALEKEDGKPFVLSRTYRSRPALVDAKARLEILDRNEVDIHVLVPIPWLEAFPRIAHDRTLAPQFARMMNDEIAAVVAAHPKRFRGVALVACGRSRRDGGRAHPRREGARLRRRLLPVGPTAKRMDHPDFEPLYRAIVDLDVMLWLHPSRPPVADYTDEKTSLYQVWQQMGWPYDTTAAMYRIVFSGVFERHPSIRIITHHHGGFVPYYQGGMRGSWAASEEEGRSSPTRCRGPTSTTSGSSTATRRARIYVPKVLELALDFFGPERMLFGSDTPFGAGDGQSFTGGALRSIEAMQIAPEVRRTILLHERTAVSSGSPETNVS